MNFKLNNKGMSLVELLLAMAIAAVVSLLISVMITQGTSMFGKETEKIDLMDEIQVVQNLVETELMEAKAMNIVKTGDDVRIYTGKINPVSNELLVKENGETGYTEAVITYLDGKLYITPNYMETISKGYLVSDEVLEFDITVSANTEEETTFVDDGEGNTITKTITYYNNPITVDLHMVIGKEDNNKVIDKTVRLRNEIEEYNIYKPADFSQMLNGATVEKLKLR